MSGLILAKGIDERGSSKVRLATRDFSVCMARHVEIFSLVCAACNKILESLQCRTDSSSSQIWLPATRSPPVLSFLAFHPLDAQSVPFSGRECNQQPC